MNGSPQRVNSCTILGPDGHTFRPEDYQSLVDEGTDPMWSRAKRT
jgi:hypothetical protein